MKTTYSLLLLLVCFVFYGCASLDHVEPLKGDIEGNVNLVDDRIPFIADLSGITVRLEGIDPVIEVQTDRKGHWIMKDVPAGTYTVTYSKEKFNVYKQFGVEHVGGRVPSFPYPYDIVTLYARTETKVLTFTPTGQVRNDYGFKGTSTPGTGLRAAILFFSNEGDASPTNYSYFTIASIDPSGDLRFNFSIINARDKLGYKSGEEISVKAYGFVFSTYPDALKYSYYDPNLDLRVYTNISEEGIAVKFTMP